MEKVLYSENIPSETYHNLMNQDYCLFHPEQP